MAAPEPLESLDLRTRYLRSAVSPAARNDLLGGREIAAFAFCKRPKPPNSSNDRVVFAGEESASEQCVPDPSDPRLDRKGASSVERLTISSLAHAPRVLRDGFERELDRLGEQGEAIRELLDAIVERGHDVWLVGGAVRELLADGAAANVKDLDFTGTIGPGELSETAGRVLRANGNADLDWRWSTSGRLVWSVRPYSGGPRVVEYKPLALNGFPQSVWGGDFTDDVATRDLTFNALAFDPFRNLLIDPSGEGLAHLLGRRRVLATPLRDGSPRGLAEVVLRSLKFQLRWRERELDLRPMREFVAGLPADLVERIDCWDVLVSARERWIAAEDRGAAELEQARLLGPAAEALVRGLQGRAGA